MIARIQQALLGAQLLISALLAAWFMHSTPLPMAAAVLLALIIPFMVQSALIGAECLIAWWVRDEPGPTQSATGDWIRAWWKESLAAWRTFNFAQPLLGHLPVVRPGTAHDATAVPVLLVHGFFCNRALWRPMAQALAARGHAVEAIDLEPAFGSIDAYTAQINAAVAALKARTGAARVALVCHSMGGLAVRAWLRTGNSAQVCKIITLGTPHQGTVLAALGHGRNVREMRRDSRWLKQLAVDEAAMGPDHAPDYLVIRTWQDNIVAPQSPQTLPQATIRSFRGLGHVGLVYDEAVLNTVLQALQLPESAFRPQK
jgi:triacylglycerol esterase/lipase EstA (alpha/beta hydrolase family)